MTVELTTLDVPDGTKMQVHIARPEGEARKGILLFQEAFGVNDYMERVALRLAAQGYLTIAPELFHRTAPPGFVGSYNDYSGVKPHMQALADEFLTMDMRAAFDWLTGEGIARRRIAALGFCMGGRTAFLANIELPIAASISFYGGGIAESLLTRAEELHGPQLLIWGGKDAQIGRDTPRRVADALSKGGIPFVEAVFTEGGHGFVCDARDAYHAPSARMAWALADAFLAEHTNG